MNDKQKAYIKNLGSKKFRDNYDDIDWDSGNKEDHITEPERNTYGNLETFCGHNYIYRGRN